MKEDSGKDKNEANDGWREEEEGGKEEDKDCLSSRLRN